MNEEKSFQLLASNILRKKHNKQRNSKRVDHPNIERNTNFNQSNFSMNLYFDVK